VKAVCRVAHLGSIAYEEAWQLQDRLAREIAAGEREPTLLLLEHPPTYTFGRSGHIENLLWDKAELERRGIAVHWVDRGGDVTYHGPGQLVGYPLLPLGRPGVADDGRDSSRPRGPTQGPPPRVLRLPQGLRLPQADYVGYLRRLETSLIAGLARLGVAGRQIPGLTGVWVNLDGATGRPAKIAAIGVKVDARGVSHHGFALNVNPDMSYWEGIIGCGLEDSSVASLGQLLDPPPPMEAVVEAVVAAFGEVFEFEMAPAQR
jgi:lipoyl(octanoyl) transferase